MGWLTRRILTGPKSNLVQMALNYGTHILQTVLYGMIVGQHLMLRCSFAFSLIEMCITFLLVLVSLTCSFTDPGILTIKTSVRYLDEEIVIPTGIRYGEDYYR